MVKGSERDSAKNAWSYIKLASYVKSIIDPIVDTMR